MVDTLVGGNLRFHTTSTAVRENGLDFISFPRSHRYDKLELWEGISYETVCRESEKALYSGNCRIVLG
jgi:hypothetical protein